ncbi:MAG: hypothetical protein LBL05_03880, partial [Synergistaceae bacterium]|nr:hypothetical protein [Synergistaceae bacterium]
MAVQMAPPANDLAQVCVSAKTAADFGDAGAAFKNILQGMRESRQKTPQTAPKGAKAPVNFAFLAGDADGDAANLEEPALIRPAEFEKTPDDGQEATPPSRFDPDVFLEALEAAAADKPDNCGEDAGRTEEDEPTPEGGAAEAETAPQPGDTPPVCDDKAQSETPAVLAAIAETNAPALPAVTEGKTEADEKNFSDGAAERPVQSAETQSGETAKLAAEDASRETKPRESQRAGAAKLSDSNENINENENTENIGRETSSAREDGEHAAAEKSGTRVPKAVSRASEAVHKSGGQETADAGKSPSGNSLSEKSAPEHAESLSIPAANPFGAPDRAEARPVFQPPAVYTLTSGD